MQIDGQTPRMSAAMAERTKNLLDAERCAGWECSSDTARFTQRVIAGNVTVHIQCTGCGRSVGVLKRAEVYHWQDLPRWDAELGSQFGETIHQRSLERIRDLDGARAEREEEAGRRRTDYSRWLLTSPDWRTLRDRVMRRAMFICEACLANKASDVHHVTYQMGKLPPAWELRAVCRQCHDNLHNWVGGEP